MAVMAVLSFGCVHIDVDNGRADKVRPIQNQSIETDSAPVDKVVQKVEPSSMDEALLYSLLGGELAGQRGEIELASAFYLEAAKRSRDPRVALRAAQIALYTKDIVAAKLMADVLVNSHAPTLEIHRLALTIYLKAADLDKSIQQALLLITNSDIPQRNSILAVGSVVSRHAKNEVAVAVLAALVERYPDEAGVYLAQSQLNLELADLQSAERSANLAIQLAPEWQVAYAHLAQVLEKQGKTKSALVTLKQASDRFKTPQLILAYGQLLAKEGQYETAKKQFQNALDKEPMNAEAKFSLALMYLKLDQLNKAKDTLKSLYASGTYKSKAAFYLGQITYQQQAYQEALSWFSKVGQAPGFIDSQANIAIIHAKLGNLTKAQSVLQRLRNNSPKLAARFYLLEAELLMDAHQNQASYDLMNEALRENAADLTLRYARSIAATELGEMDVAESDLLFILTQEPNNVNALNALGYALASKTFRFKEARKYLTQALSLTPEDSAVIDSMGWLNYREGQYEEALVLLEKAYKKSPQGEIAAHLGEALWMLGRQEEAKNIWHEGLKRNPNDRYLKEVLKRLK